MLKGEVVNRDFYMIQTPGILFYNQWLFKFFGVSLLTSLRGVLVFKVLTVLMAYVVARRVVSWRLALVPALLSFVWLAPGGPFRPAPIQHEMLFALVAAFFTLRWIERRTFVDPLFAGLAVGLLAMFKQNTGLYCAAALVFSLLIDSEALPDRLKNAPGLLVSGARRNRKALLAAFSAWRFAPWRWLFTCSARRSGIDALDFCHISGVAHSTQADRVSSSKTCSDRCGRHARGACRCGIPREAIHGVSSHSSLRALSGSSRLRDALARRSRCNGRFWFQPPLFAGPEWSYFRGRASDRAAETGRRCWCDSVFDSMFLESFPRTVRGLIIGSLPIAFVLAVFLFNRCRLAEDATVVAGSKRVIRSPSRLAFAAMTAVMFVLALKLIAPRYVSSDDGLSLKLRANTEPSSNALTESTFRRREPLRWIRS